VYFIGATKWPIVPASDDMMNADGRGTVDGILGNGNRSTRRKASTAPVLITKSHMTWEASD
jgi:hypothetical protein